MKIKPLFLSFVIGSLLINCGIDEEEIEAEEEIVSEEESLPFNADITGTWKVDSLVTSSSCEDVITDSVSSTYLIISTDTEDQVYDSGMLLEDASYVDGVYRYYGTAPGEEDVSLVLKPSLYLSVRFIDNDRGEGHSIYNRPIVESSFSSFFEFSNCTVLSNVDFTRQ